MKKLTHYTKNGHEFEIIERMGDIGIFKGTRIGGLSVTWEVIHIQSHNGREVHGTYCPPSEYPPSNEQWGAKGWTYQTEAQARVKFEKEAQP